MFENMSPEAIAAYRALQTAWGEMPGINSAYRDPAHNSRVGGAKNSQHTHGNAFDLDVSGWPTQRRLDFINAAREAGFSGVGVYDNSLHFDTGPQRAWGPDHSRSSIPEWAMAALPGQSERMAAAKAGNMAYQLPDNPAMQSDQLNPQIAFDMGDAVKAGMGFSMLKELGDSTQQQQQPLAPQPYAPRDPGLKYRKRKRPSLLGEMMAGI